jgi:hypothetical protein
MIPVHRRGGRFGDELKCQELDVERIAVNIDGRY